jgi:4-hydroxy-2-oxoheptanedioate aldolase
MGGSASRRQFPQLGAVNAYYGITWPHIDTVEDAYNAVAAMRYPKVEGRPLREPFGRRGDAPNRAVTYWGITQQEYYQRADLWPLDPQGELICCLMIESPEGISSLAAMLAKVPDIGMIFTGEGDLSQELGHPRQIEHPEDWPACGKSSISARPTTCPTAGITPRLTT